MQAQTRQELREVKATVRKVLTNHPAARGNDDTLYYKVCKERAAEIGVDITRLHFSAVFLGNPFGFPKYESVVRLRRMVQRQDPDLQAPPEIKAGRKKKEDDFVEFSRKRGILQ